MKQEKKKEKKTKGFEKSYFNSFIQMIKADKNINDTFKRGIK